MAVHTIGFSLLGFQPGNALLVFLPALGSHGIDSSQQRLGVLDGFVKEIRIRVVIRQCRSFLGVDVDLLLDRSRGERHIASQTQGIVQTLQNLVGFLHVAGMLIWISLAVTQQGTQRLGRGIVLGTGLGQQTGHIAGLDGGVHDSLEFRRVGCVERTCIGCGFRLLGSQFSHFLQTTHTTRQTRTSSPTNHGSCVDV